MTNNSAIERPKRLTSEMKLAAAERTVASLMRSGHLELGEQEDAVKAIAKHGTLYDDGYALAKNLDTYEYWDCDLMMADDLDQFGTFARDELEKAQADWAKVNNIQPSLSIGTAVLLKSNETGLIDGIYEHGVAQYLVKIDGDPEADGPSNSRRIVNFEDATSAVLEAMEIVE